MHNCRSDGGGSLWVTSPFGLPKMDSSVIPGQMSCRTVFLNKCLVYWYRHQDTNRHLYLMHCLLSPNQLCKKKTWQSICSRFHMLRVISEWCRIKNNTYNLLTDIFSMEIFGWLLLSQARSCILTLALQKKIKKSATPWYQSFLIQISPT